MSFSFAPYLSSDIIVQTHAAAATVALVLGPVVIHRRRRDRTHKVAGYVWVLAMAFAALSSFGITDFAMIGPFSPIHALSVLVLWSLWVGMRHAFRGEIAEHRDALRSLYYRGLLIAAAFNFLPGRVVNRMFFNDHRELGYVVLALGLGLVLADVLRGRIARKNRAALAA
ncbi:DUF2306 domain-containing protein [Mesobacterium sp. TK19101]|uniref:DUF2306 domain-containing protein n=1 Tax=Mesobacterium hydrothermale TaxID=3111907 RepID=A0ABU6HF49_9RHOB|nr:DUF2306 domain-containing protein [Mesobacterium sp. TK19101]MEC3860304.1 DUF2306 domain-containing protein [Mesobacterium sp. TK19101]